MVACANGYTSIPVVNYSIQVYPDEQGSSEPGWLAGWKGDKCGIFPANYVTKQREVYEPIASGEKAPSSAPVAEAASAPVAAPAVAPVTAPVAAVTSAMTRR